MSELTVGQKLWLVPQRGYGVPREVTVAKIGRKWATLDGWRESRIDKETLWMDGGVYTSPGRCYLSREEWEESQRLSGAWGVLKTLIADRWNRPDGVTIADMRAAANLLRVEWPEDTHNG